MLSTDDVVVESGVESRVESGVNNDNGILATQLFLMNNTLEDLKTQFGINVKEYDNFVGLNYDQVNSPKSHPISIECRSLKLVKNTWDVASRAFDRFFNYGECPEQYKDFRFDTSVIMEKVDGSLIPIWYNSFDNKWEISSRAALFGESIVNDTGKTFRQSVLDVLQLSENEFQDLFQRIAQQDLTYIFEYIGPDNFIVTPYLENQLVLTGIRNSHTGKYFSLDQMNTFLQKVKKGNVRIVKTYFQSNSFDDIISSLNELKGLEEGYVCWDMEHDIRVKVKSPKYVAMHHLRGENNIVTKERLIDVAVRGELDEVTTYFPHLAEKLKNIKEEIQKRLKEMCVEYDKISSIKEQKDFAKEASKHNYKNILFFARKNKTSVIEEYENMDDEHKVKFIAKHINTSI